MGESVIRATDCWLKDVASDMDIDEKIGGLVRRDYMACDFITKEPTMI
jgi:hypothetical protein